MKRAGSLVDRILARARAELEADVCEATGHNDGLPSTRYMGGRQEPWCAHAIAYLYREEGAPLPGDVVPDPHHANPLALVATMERVFREHGWLVTSPMRGDLIFFAAREHSDHSRGGRHVAIIERVALTTISTLGANEGNSWRRTTYRRAGLDARVTSYGRRPEP